MPTSGTVRGIDGSENVLNKKRFSSKRSFGGGSFFCHAGGVFFISSTVQILKKILPEFNS
jgi:hypothetical protein